MSGDLLNEKDVEKMLEKIVLKVLPTLMKDKLNNIRIGIVVNVKTARIVDVKILGTGDTLTSVPVQQGATDVVVGNQCLVLSPDPLLRGQAKAIIF